MPDVVIQIKEYRPENGIDSEWDDDSLVKTTIDGDAIVIVANAAGLLSLARLLVTLAQANVPSGSHVHLDYYNAPTEGSAELIMQRSNKTEP